ncbi:unnamed protein product [Calicophoron daubneyi]|uniref:tRNA pseudouridine(55) synthase n=1 Tax=Calicophoron daubneyi TaxID=300641 RepID=A0AAV2TRM2_CALDB
MQCSRDTLAKQQKVPVIGEMEELNDTVYVKMNNLDPNAYNLECTLLRVFAEFSDPTAESECAAFVKLMANCEHPAVQEWTDRMANGPKRKRRRRRSTRRLERPEVTDSQAAKTSDDDDSANIQTGLSKTRLLPLLNDLFEHSIYICPELDLVTSLAVLHSLTLGRSVPMIVAGRYVKLNRRLPQTPWIVNYERKLPSSVEELIVDPLTAQFGSDTHTTFTSSGREDVDARCLGLGRPFMITMENYRGYVPEILSRFSAQADSPDCCVQSSETRVCELLRLATLINAQSKGKVFVRDLQLVRSKTATKAIKDGELQKSKTYRALCWCPGGGLNTQLIKHFATSYKSVSPLDALQWPPESKGDSYGFVQFGPIRIRQPTPIRVLHRRPLLNRIRTIHSLCLVDYKEAMKQHIPEMADFESWMKLYSPEELFFVELRCEAGTYVKEFVHGDLGRCQPSLASIFNRQIDILALDVTAVELDWPPRLPDPKSD